MSSPIRPPLTVTTVGGSPSGRPITTIKVSDGDLTISGNVATIDTSGSGGSPGGSNNEIQFNDSGAFGGDAGFLMNVKGDGTTTKIQVGNILVGANLGVGTAATNGTVYIQSDGSGQIFLTSGSDSGGTFADTVVNVNCNAGSDNSILRFRDNSSTKEANIISSTGAAGILKNSQNNQDLRLQVSGTGNVRIENQTTDTASQLNVKGNGTGEPIINLSNDTKAVTIKCDENQKLKVAGGSSNFIFDASSATGGITWPDGTTQITAASASTNNFDVAPRTQGASVWGSFTRFDVSKDIAYGSGFARNFNNIDQDKVYCWPFIGSNTGNVSEMGIYANTSGTYTVYAGIYSDNAGQPDTLLGYATFSVTGANIYYQTSFSTTISMVRGVQYWYAFKHEHNTSVSFRCMDQTYQNAIQTVSSANQSNQVQYYTYSSSALESDLSSVTWIPQASIGRFILTLKW